MAIKVIRAVTVECDDCGYTYVYKFTERGKHCPHCMDGEALTSDAGQHDFRIMGDGLFYFDSQLGWEGVTINFCPWCGRDLTREE